MRCANLTLVPSCASLTRGYSHKTPTSLNYEERAMDNQYFIKPNLITPNELDFFRIFRSVLPNSYIVLPQVPLSSVIEKGKYTFQGELFRVLDFGIFTQWFNPLLMIEINDRTHLQEKRIGRDMKVNDICRSAGLPLLFLWTQDKHHIDYIVNWFRYFRLIQ